MVRRVLIVCLTCEIQSKNRSCLKTHLYCDCATDVKISSANPIIRGAVWLRCFTWTISQSSALFLFSCINSRIYAFTRLQAGYWGVSVQVPLGAWQYLISTGHRHATIKWGKINFIGHILHSNCLLNTLLKEKQRENYKEQEEEEEDVSSYWMALRELEDTEMWMKKN